MSMKPVAVLLLCTAASFFARAQGQVSMPDDRAGFAYDFQVFFPVNSTVLQADYMDNPRALAVLDSIITIHSSAAIDSVSIVSFSSPEGSYRYNLRLAERRGASMKNYLLEHFPLLKGRISVDAGVSEWPEPGGDLTRLRYAAFRLVFPFDISVPNLGVDFEIDESYYVLTEPYDIPAPEIEPEPLICTIPEYISTVLVKNNIIAFKTNLLYDAVTALNVEAELPVGRRFSLVAEDLFPWWEYGNKYCLQLWEMGAEARFWFTPWDNPGTNKLEGFFAGPYGMSGKYDLQWDTAIDYQGEFWSAGISGGWSKPIGRNGWGRLELSMRLGYLQTDWRHYYPTDSYDKLIRDKSRTGRTMYWGPTKAALSLVIPISVNCRKKEARND